MKHIRKFESYKTIKRREEIIKESVLQVNDIYKVRTLIDIPQSLVNAYVKKVKDTSGKNLRQFFGDVDIAEEIVKYVTLNFINVDQVPAGALTGDTVAQDGSPQAAPQSQAPGQAAPQAQAQPAPAQGDIPTGQPQAQGQAQAQPAQAQAQPAQAQPAQGQAQPQASQAQATQAQSQSQPQVQVQTEAQPAQGQGEFEEVGEEENEEENEEDNEELPL